ncbi:MAG: GNAT family N-acetyltransferase [Gaiellaceae bacterium]
MDLRPAADGDLPVLHRIFIAAVRSVFEPHRFAPPAPRFDVFASLQRHIARTGSSVVAVGGGAVLGFASVWRRDRDWFLASLFVDPAVHARGVGGALVDSVWGDADARRTITDAIQPVSNGLYGRRGLVPATPVLGFVGRPRRAGTAPPPPEPADVAAIDAAAYGFDRALDHDYWSHHARRTTWADAYSYAFPGGDIGPVAGLDAAAAARALAGELALAEGDVRLRIPGSSRALVEVALAAGLQPTPVPGLLLLSDGVAPPTSLAIAGYALY